MEDTARRREPLAKGAFISFVGEAALRAKGSNNKLNKKQNANLDKEAVTQAT